MDRMRMLDVEWEACYERLARGEFFHKLASGALELRHYKGFLRESFHNTRQNPGTMAMFAAHVKSGEPGLKAKFLKHTAMELGHDEMALDDLRVLGEDVETIRNGLPLVATEAMTGFIMLQIQHRNPLAFLGYSYHLEAIPVRMGSAAMGALVNLGIPMNAVSFLKEHIEADPVHSKWNRDYVEGFVRTASDLEAVVYGMRGTCELHGLMFQAIDDGYEAPPISWTPAAQTSAEKQA
ncbi:MAG: iron-containing redox enzyme family protein [Fibrobacterota bacterium]|nr:iron-containing redox enzyme family protein [Fibrobacterota bacterium]